MNKVAVDKSSNSGLACLLYLSYCLAMLRMVSGYLEPVMLSIFLVSYCLVVLRVVTILSL